MPALYLLDTNTASYIIKGKPPGVRERLLQIPISEIAISVITEAELRFGVARKPEFAHLGIAVEEFLKQLEVLMWNSECAQQYAMLRALVERAGEPIGNMDLMIAAHAIALSATLVTSDRIFRRLKHLTIEDWTT